MRGLSGNDHGMMWANRIVLVTYAHPYLSIEDQHRLLDGMLMQWCAGTWSYRIDEETYRSCSVLHARQELTTNSRAHFDLRNILMMDDRHRQALALSGRAASSEMRHEMGRRATHRDEHGLMGQQSPWVKPTNQLNENTT
jgi:hypothetical protein